MLFILNKRLEVLDILTNTGDVSHITPYFDDVYSLDLTTGAETFEFYTLANTKQSQHLVVGNSIAFQYKGNTKLFNIISIEESHTETFEKKVYCEMAGIELINEVIRPTTFNNNNLRRFAESILADTSWQVGKMDIGFNDLHDIEISEYTTVYECLQNYAIGVFGAEISFRVELKKNRVVAKYVDFYLQRGRDNGFRFDYTSNVSSIARSVDTSELVTALIGVGNDNITFKEVEAVDKPLNQDFIASEEAYKSWNQDGSHLMGYVKFDTNSPQELLNLTREELTKRCVPKIAYEMKVEVLGEDDVEIGDTVYIADHEFNPPIQLSARVSQLKISFTDKTKDECVLANFKEINSKITDELRGLLESKFPIGTNDILNGAITSEKLENGQIITGTHLFANSITADKIMAGEIHTKHLASESITADKIKAGEITADKLNADVLKANNIEFDIASGNVLNLQTLLSQFVSGNNGQFLNLTGSNAIFADAIIKDAMIDSINANKISAGNIDTNNVTIQGKNGNLIIQDNTIQVKDTNNNVRVQIGLDANGDYTLSTFDEDGNMMFGSNGITENGIKDSIIRDDMVAPNANISGDKLNINSVVNNINDNSTQTLKSNKIEVDEDGQTLDVAFKKMTSTIESIKTNGVNILLNSQLLTDENWVAENCTKEILEDIQDTNYNYLKVKVDANSDVGSLSYTPNINLIDKEYYTFSAYVRGAIGQVVKLGTKNAFKTFEIENSDWQRVHATFLMSKENVESEDILVSKNEKTVTIQFEGNGEFNFKKPQLEKSKGLSDFSFNPDDTLERIKVNSTAIRVEQGRIEQLIKDTTIVTDGQETVKLKDAYNLTKDTVDQFTKVLADNETSFDGVVQQIKSNTSSISQLNNEIELKVNSTEVKEIVDEELGTTVKSTDVEYYLSTSSEELIGGSWSTSISSSATGKYLWSRVKTVLGNGTVSYSEPVCISSGVDVNGIKEISEEYYLSTSKEQPMNGEWVNSCPVWKKGMYLWTRTKFTYTDDEVVYTTPLCDTTWEVVNNIQVGGSNLLDNTALTKTDENWIVNKCVKRWVETKEAYLDITSDIEGSLIYEPRNLFKENNNYTFSIYVKGAQGSTVCIGTDGDNSGEFSSRYKKEFVLQTDKWTRINCSFYVDGNGVEIPIIMENENYIYNENGEDYLLSEYDIDIPVISSNEHSTVLVQFKDAGKYQFKKPQLETGLFMSDYKQSLADLNKLIEINETSIKLTDKKIESLAQSTSEDINGVKNSISTMLQTSEKIQSTVEQVKKELTETGKIVSKNSSSITQLSDRIDLKADSTTTDELTQRIQSAELSLTPNAIVTTVTSSPSFNQIMDSKVSSSEYTSMINQMNNSISSKVSSEIYNYDKGEINNRLSQAEQKITDDSIISTVTTSKVYKDALSEKVNTDVYNSAISQLNNSISTKVTKNDVGSLIQQNADSVKIAFGHIGNGANLMKNGDGSFGTNSWGWASTSANATFETIKINNRKGFALRASNSSCNTERCVGQRVQVKPNTTYTLSYWIYSDDGVQSYDVYAGGGVTGSTDWRYTRRLDNQKYHTNMEKHSHKIVTNHDETWLYIRFDNNGWRNGTYHAVVFCEVKLEEGDKVTPFCLAVGETIGAVTQIDENGIKVSHNNGSYTTMGADGFKFHVGSNGHEYHSLIHRGTVVTMGNTTGGVEVKLPDEFKNKKPVILLSLWDTYNSANAKDRLNKITYFVKNWDVSNGVNNNRFSIIGYALYNNGSKTWTQKIGVQWVAIA